MGLSSCASRESLDDDPLIFKRFVYQKFDNNSLVIIPKYPDIHERILQYKESNIINESSAFSCFSGGGSVNYMGLLLKDVPQFRPYMFQTTKVDLSYRTTEAEIDGKHRAIYYEQKIDRFEVIQKTCWKQFNGSDSYIVSEIYKSIQD